MFSAWNVVDFLYVYVCIGFDNIYMNGFNNFGVT